MQKKNKIIGIIPARYGSTRFPGKPLADIKGISMIERVYRQSVQAKNIHKIIVATDDERIANHVSKFGGNAVITKSNHPSGTDRCFEALQLQDESFDYVINIQGDEPFIQPEQIDELAGICEGSTELATQMIKIDSCDVLFDEGEVKIVLNQQHEAIYFSRAVIPYLKGIDKKEWHLKYNFYRHVGLYAYRTDILEKITQLKPSLLEMAESLEQLRWLEAGYKIKCVETKFESYCIDTPDDIAKVIKTMGLN